ncbi:hypothetical protein [Paenibacillus mucilaginosus]|uniref:Uncharacterized protein n=3 Tax=Paenibacillus mucilaginosus TaxID=61624 RepID=H6NR53_9BACL|nr:hypothetical protein [Paenibacillus mucilaginosus]AEI45013.1 conserved hypothetical protein [Paenibacillus mucilaginosus KNP414]AFC32746.1 hypothetical protein PM3016_6101 [Paenibacillus mucilaginosus 3016]AFH65081.1 hypothetical protein B2K_30985 [Paenibacillus mucilaginosus K02]MCG7213082.1 hypothetical protein [Paenibacillus mucilaginosus]WDM26513.1 hypothetical protein KCX80_29460 [Paenibacillus mucilaginosus]
MKKALSQQQKEYKEAKEHFEQTNKDFEQKLAATKLLGTVNQETMERLVEDTGLHTALNRLGAAESALLKWSKEMIKKEKDYLQNKEAVDRMYAFIDKNPHIKAQLIQAAMNMN